MNLLARAMLIFGLLIAVLIGARVDLMRPIDQALDDVRFRASSRSPSGDIVFVDIDGASLQRVGVWPWPRLLHAQVLDKLMALGADEVVFDIDFSTASTESNDAAFEAALERAGGYANLAAFQQRSGSSGLVVLNQPLPRFARHADSVLVNVQANSGGPLRWVPAFMMTPHGKLPSVAASLTPAAAPPETIYIDYGIDLAAIDRIPVAQLLYGDVSPGRLAGKQVVIGASAIELRDFFAVPRYGVIAGAMVQIAAAESLRAGRWLTDLGLVPAGLAAALIGLLALWRGAKVPLLTQAGALVFGSVLTEFVAWALLKFGALTFQTTPIHAAFMALLVVAFVEERAVRRLQYEREHRERETMRRVLGQVVTDNFDGILVIDQDNMTLAASQAAAAILGQEISLQGRDIRTYLPVQVLHWLAGGNLDGPHECVCDIAWQSRTLELIATRSEVPVANSREGSRRVTCLTFQDITERLRQQQRLTYLARHDPVTGALSRQAMADEIDASLSGGEALRVMIVRLGRLRNVTTALGHQVTEAVLRQANKRLRGISGLQTARLGTDVFGLWLPLDDSLGPDDLVATIADILDAPYELDGHAIILESVFGTSSTITAPANSTDLLRQAEIALSVHDERAPTKVTVFTPDLEDHIAHRQELDSALRQALERNEFFLVFQPQVDLKTGGMVGVEALVRWRNESLGVVSPGDFIPLAEETGLIIALGDWVMKEACRQAALWIWDGRLSVNVSAVQFRLGDVVGTVLDATRCSGFAAQRLDIEITESLFAANDPGILAALDELRAMGVGIAIDDFGTGYSSLSYLARLPVDKIKIDQSFVSALPTEQSKAIIDTIAALALRLGKTVIAEGIETPEQLSYLSGIHCQIGQGYHFGRPASAPDIGLVARDPA